MKTFTLRPYQQEASDAAVQAFKNKINGLIVLPTGSGKSLVVADIASRISEPILILQPSKEILEQNYLKLASYGVMDISIFSASLNRKEIAHITFATIGSIMARIEEFDHFHHIIIDEAHAVNPKGGQYEEFIHRTQRIVIGLTATPYRLYSTMAGAMLKFITRTKPRIFQKVIYHCQVADLLQQGFLAKLKYYDISAINTNNLIPNSTGADYRDDSVRKEYQRANFNDKLVSITNRLLHPKSGIPRQGILVFTRFIEEAQYLADNIPNAEIVTGETPKREREDILARFKAGEIKVVANVGTLTTGFDYPELDTILIARPTKSLSLYYQIVGRAIRPYPSKEGWIVDLCGTYKRFGRVEDLHLCTEPKSDNKWQITSKGRPLTNVLF